jgi:hypothetical protein
VIVIRYADDTIVGFQHEHEAKAFLHDLHERMRKFEPCLSGSLPLMLPGGSNHRCRDFCTWELRRGQPIQERS